MNKDQIEKFRDFLQEKDRQETADLQNRLNRARDDFNKIVAMLIKKHNPKRIYQWGSLVNEEGFSKISDIDIAVEGIQSQEKFFTMFGEADAITSFHLDLIDIDKIHPLHARDIRINGRIVYERSPKDQAA